MGGTPGVNVIAVHSFNARTSSGFNRRRPTCCQLLLVLSE